MADNSRRGPHLLAVAQQAGPAVVLVRRRGGIEECVERGLAVDHDLAFARQVDNHVRPQLAVLPIDGSLLDKVASVAHARQFDQPPKGDLAPLPARLRATQRADKLRGLKVQRAVCLRQRAELLAKHAVGLDARFLDINQSGLILVEQFLHRLEKALDLRLTLVKRAGSLGGQLAELF